MKQDILFRDKNGLPVSTKEPDFEIISQIQIQTRRILAELNLTYHNEDEIRELLQKLTGQQIDNSVRMLTPFYTDFGRNITFGKNVFINTNCTFMDRGGITIDDGAFIGPNVNLITINHDLEPTKRHITYCKPIHICKNVWIGAGAIVLPGVTIGEGAIVGAGSVVTKDVLKNTAVAGVPARKVKDICAKANEVTED